MKVYIKSATNVADIEAKIANKQTIIDKKNAWIAKKEASIEKKLKVIENGVTPEDYEYVVTALEWLKDNNGYRRPEQYSLYELRRKYIDNSKDHDMYDVIGSAEDDAESIYNSKQVIQEETAIMEKHIAKLNEIKAKDQKVDEIPEVMKEFMNQLIDEWDRYDLDIKERSPQFYQELKAKMREVMPTSFRGKEKAEKLLELYPRFADRYARADSYDKYKIEWAMEDNFKEDYLLVPFKREFGVSLDYAQDLWNRSDEQIHDRNVKEGKRVILDLTDRVTKITGPITSYAGLHLTQGNGGWAVLNGFVEGEDGKAEVKSILASGPIQRLHIRTLVHEVT